MITHRDRLGRIASRPLADKFWEKVNKDGPVVRPELGPCWTWVAQCLGNGYGALKTGVAVRKTHLAHRLAWKLMVGPIPRGKQVLHRCDNRNCVRADRDPAKSHLFLGTQADNLADMRAKGREAPPETRVRYGEENAAAKLTAAQVASIRKKFKPRIYGYKPLAAEFGVSVHTISAIVRGIIWSRKEKLSGEENT